MSVRNVRNAVTKNTGRAVYKSADKVNHENFPAWSMSDESRIRQLMFTGTMGSTFYATQEQVVEDSVDFINHVAKVRPEVLAQALSDGRNEGYIRTTPILGLAILSVYNPSLFRSTFNNVIKTGNDLNDFLGFIKSIGRGFGRSVKQAINAWIGEKLTPYYAIKYTKQIGDAIRIARFKTDTPITHYVLNKISGEARYNEYLEKRELPELYSKALVDHPQLKAQDDAATAIQAGHWNTAMDLIEKFKLDPMSLIGICNPPAEVWKSLATQMPVMMYLKYINKLVRENAFDVKEAKTKLTVDNLRKAKVFPFRLYTAYQNVEGSTAARNLLADVLDDYVGKYDWGKWSKRFVIAPDISGSMTSAVGSNRIVPSVIAGMFSGILYKGIEDAVLLPWSTEVQPQFVCPKKDTVITQIGKIASAHGGGTKMEAPVDYMIKRDIKCDIFIGITDSMEYGTGWLKSWKEYRRKNPNAKAVLIRVDNYNSNPFPEAEADNYGIYQVYGWSDSVLGFIESVVL